MSEAAPWAVRLTGVRHTYGKTLALADVSLAVAAGEALVVIGPDGVGIFTFAPSTASQGATGSSRWRSRPATR